MSYQGWKNRATWAVNLWLDNDQGIYSLMVENAENADDAIDLADQIDDLVTEMIDAENIQNGMVSDLLNGALADVDFREIAQVWFDEYGDADDE